MSLTQEIKEQAHALGFSLTGITSGEALPHEEVFEGWLKAGRHGEMAYLDSARSRECRAHPKQILPECCSVVALGMRYPAPLPQAPQNVERLRGRVAAYAWGEDYHRVLPDRLHALAAFIEERVGRAVPKRGYTDTGPLLERELAQAAGLGWIGKNTCLIDPHQGSCFLLAELLVGIELEPDSPFTADRCGTCRRCIEACPTGCILPDRTLDAKRCISYLTIELKGVIPQDLRTRMGAWVFGCDVCQQVCPWNRFAAPEGDSALRPRIASPMPDLLEEMALQASEFNRKYRHSPLQRAKRRGYLRNVAVALGNAHDPVAVPALVKALSDPEALVRGHAAWALGQIGGREAVQALGKAAETESDAVVKEEIQGSLGASEL